MLDVLVVGVEKREGGGRGDGPFPLSVGEMM